MLIFLYYYKNTILPKYIKIFCCLNKQNLPKFTYIVIHTNFGKEIEVPLKLQSNINFLRSITGRHPKYTKVKHTINNFKIKKGNISGLKITLRRFILYNFLEKLIKLVFPKIRNFSGFSKNNFDKKGNFSFGLSDIRAFPEIEFSDSMPARLIHGIEITIGIKGTNVKECYFLLNQFNFPFNK